MRVSGLDRLVLEVNSLEESLTFYRDVLGFKVERHSPESEPPMATLKAGELTLTLAQHLETMLRRGRGVNFFFGVDDVGQYFTLLSERGAEVSPPADEGWGGRFITLQDPDRYRFFFVQWSSEGVAKNEDTLDVS